MFVCRNLAVCVLVGGSRGSGRVSGGVYIVWARKSICRVGIVNVEANVATRHDILVYLLEANIAGNVATSIYAKANG